MWIGVISLFPSMFKAISEYGITGRAIKNGLVNIEYWNPRKFTDDNYHTVDNSLYGGGPGMLLMVKPLQDAIHAAKNQSNNKATKVIYLSPQGRLLNHQSLIKLIEIDNSIILVCGRYRGVDQRLIDTEIDEEWSIGDYVISGGELAAMIIIDSIIRLIPGALNHKSSIIEETFNNGILDYPNYTRPKIINGLNVPSILLTGNHTKIRRWRLKQSLGSTWLKKPELLKKIKLTNEQSLLLNEFKREYFLHIKDEL